MSWRRKVLERGSVEVPGQSSGEIVGFSRRRRKLCAGAEKNISWRRQKATFIHYRKKKEVFTTLVWEKLCPAGKLFLGGKLSPRVGEGLAWRLLV